MNSVEWLDTRAGEVVASLHRPWLNAIMIASTNLGEGLVTATISAVIVVILLANRRGRPAVCIIVAVAAGFVYADGVKAFVGRPRPDAPWRLIELPATSSFPSSHAADSMAAYASLGLIAGRRLPRRWLRILALSLGLALPLLVGFTRVYLGVHYCTDVLAGWAGGLTLALLAAWIDRRWSDDNSLASGGRQPPDLTRRSRPNAESGG